LDLHISRTELFEENFNLEEHLPLNQQDQPSRRGRPQEGKNQKIDGKTLLLPNESQKQISGQ
jgi:hypothetical protein